MIECFECGFCIDRSNGLHEADPRHEAYENLYGTICPQCGKFIEPIIEAKFVKENRLKLELLQEEIREKFRKKVLETTNDDTE